MSRPRFLYQAHALGVSGRITRPFERVLPSQAVSVLGPAGGVSSGRRCEFRFDEILSFGAAHSQTLGDYNSATDMHETMATATVERYNVHNVVLAETITARLTSTHAASKPDVPSISPQGSYIRDLWVAGRKIELESRVDLYAGVDTLDRLRQNYKDNSEFRRQLDADVHLGRHDQIAERQRKYFPWSRNSSKKELPEYLGNVVVPLFIVKNPSAPGFEVTGNLIHVRGFGFVHIGELVISAYERRITMLHVDLGSVAQGYFSAAAVGGNGGHTDPP